MNDEKLLGSSSLIDDKTTVTTIRNLLSAPPPPGIGPVDLLHVIRLILSKAEDHPVFNSQQNLAESFGVDIKTIVRSQQRLEKIGWLSRPERKGRTRALSLNFDKIPAEEPLRLKISPLAKKVAVIYQSVLQQEGRKRFPKHWLKQQEPSAQRLLDRCSGDAMLLGKVIEHALTWSTHKEKSRKGLYAVLVRWKKIMQTYHAVIQKKHEVQNQ